LTFSSSLPMGGRERRPYVTFKGIWCRVSARGTRSASECTHTSSPVCVCVCVCVFVCVCVCVCVLV
jgi:hypothetical protein